MRKIILSVLFFYSVMINAHAGESAKLDPKLAMFEPYLGTWEAVFEEKDGKPTVVDVSHWERALNGKALRTLHSINEGAYGGESLVFWDKEKQKIVFFYFTTADFYTTGEMEVIDDKTFVAYEEVTGESAMSKGITKVKSTSTLKGDKMEVATSYLKHGKWLPPETRTYVRSDKTVKFK
ncbi:hypothetical protein [Flocculibacter collagenilyticus]|uniref:hypothetical protein n=1 Tax=Flocculibacter collagenilyticus TaxID=2744479 RepID=UPI0018F67AE6|nr:hypothetical protein [Flocculibacter collagenilyticus]